MKMKDQPLNLALALIGPVLVALASFLPLYLIVATDGVLPGRLRTDEHAFLLLLLGSTQLLSLKRSFWSWLPLGASLLLLVTNALEIGGRLPSQGSLNYPVWFLAGIGSLLTIISLPRAAEISHSRG